MLHNYLVFSNTVFLNGVQDALHMHKALYISMAVTILIPLVWLRDMRYLAYVSMLSNILLVVSCKFDCGITLPYSVRHLRVLRAEHQSTP